VAVEFLLDSVRSISIDSLTYQFYRGKLITPDWDTSKTIYTLPREKIKVGFYRHWMDFYYNTPVYGCDEIVMERAKEDTVNRFNAKISDDKIKNVEHFNFKVPSDSKKIWEKRKIWGCYDGTRFYVKEDDSRMFDCNSYFIPLNFDGTFIWHHTTISSKVNVGSAMGGINSNSSISSTIEWVSVFSLTPPKTSRIPRISLTPIVNSVPTYYPDGSIFKDIPALYSEYDALSKIQQGVQFVDFFERYVSMKKNGQ